MTQLDSIVFDFLTTCATQAEYLYSIGEDSAAELVLKRGDEFAAEYQQEGQDGTFYCTYWRYESESFGVTFEQEHGDPELMFGGIL